MNATTTTSRRGAPARRARSLLLVAALGLAAGLVPGTERLAHAQVAAAIGRPLPAADLPAGTVLVRVVDGDFSKTPSATEVTLLVDGVARTATTDGEGRATFSGVAAGASLQAKLVGPAGEVVSQVFPAPSSGGVRLMLTTKPLAEAGAAGAAAAEPTDGSQHPGAGPAAAGGMPEPRQMSGQPRPEMADPPGSLTVRLTYDDFGDATPPAQQPVALVGYGADGKVTLQRLTSDAAGRVVATGLDVSGGTAYYALAKLARGPSFDRVMSVPILMGGETGVRVILSGDKRTSSEPGVDDYARLDNQVPGTPVGRVAVGLISKNNDQGGTMTLVDAETGQALGTQPIGPTQIGRVEIRGQFGTAAANPDVPAGTLEVLAGGGTGGSRQAVDGVLLAVMAEEPAEGAPPPPTATTDSAGRARFALAPGRYRVLASLSGTDVKSEPFTVGAEGLRLALGFIWREGATPRVAAFDGIDGNTQLVVYAEAKLGGQVYRSLPFQPVPDRGSSATVLAYPRVTFQFGLSGSAEDKYLGFQGRFTLANLSWIPYRHGPDGLLIKLPRGFVGAVVADKDQQLVTADKAEGFRIRRPLAPGGASFDGAFSLRIEGGVTRWDWDLPWGAEDSQLAIQQTPGLIVDVPAGVRSTTERNGLGMAFYVVRNLDIGPGQRMAMKVRGLPVPPAWKIWLPRLAGLLVLGLLTGGLIIAVRARRSDGPPAAEQAKVDARVAALLEELIGIDSAAAPDAERRGRVVAELERLWPASSRGRAAA